MKLPAELSALVDQVCAAKQNPDEKILVFAWSAIPEQTQRDFLNDVFNDSDVPGHFKSVLGRKGDDIYWKSTTCVPFALQGTSATKFSSSAQFDRLLLIDTKGVVYRIDVDGTAINKPDPTKTADRWQDLGLVKRDVAKKQQKAKGASNAEARKTCEALVKKATPLLDKRDYAAALALLEPPMRDCQPIEMEAGAKRDTTFEARSAVGAAFDLHGLALWGVGRRDEAFKAFQDSYTCGGTSGNRSFVHLVVAACALDRADVLDEDVADVVTYVQDKPEVPGWAKELGAVDMKIVKKIASSKTGAAAVARAVSKWIA